MHSEKTSQMIGTKQVCSLKKSLIREANQKKRFQFARELNDRTLDQWINSERVMWSDKSCFSLFHGDGCIRVRREVDEVMHPSSLVPTSL